MNDFHENGVVHDLPVEASPLKYFLWFFLSTIYSVTLPNKQICIDLYAVPEDWAQQRNSHRVHHMQGSFMLKPLLCTVSC